MTTNKKILDKFFLEEKCKNGNNCRGVQGGCPYNHHNLRGYYIPSREKKFPKLCKWELPLEKKRCKRSCCSFDHLKGRVDYINELQLKNKIKNVVINNSNIRKDFIINRNKILKQKDISWKNIDEKYKNEFIEYLNNRNEFINFIKRNKNKNDDIIKDDEIKDDGIKDDGIKDDGIKDDGIKDDGIKDDGIKDDGIKDDGIKDDVQKNYIRKNIPKNLYSQDYSKNIIESIKREINKEIETKGYEIKPNKKKIFCRPNKKLVTLDQTIINQLESIL
jgi:hypothetical protein